MGLFLVVRPMPLVVPFIYPMETPVGGIVALIGNHFFNLHGKDSNHHEPICIVLFLLFTMVLNIVALKPFFWGRSVCRWTTSSAASHIVPEFYFTIQMNTGYPEPY